MERVFCSKEVQAAQYPILLVHELNRLCLDDYCVLKHRHRHKSVQKRMAEGWYAILVLVGAYEIETLR